MSETNESQLSFSVELNSREHIKRVSLPNGTGDRLMVEGGLGKLIKIELIEDILLEIKGVNGTLRVEITREELETVFNKKSNRGSN